MKKKPCPACGRDIFENSVACEWCGNVVSTQPYIRPIINQPNSLLNWSWQSNRISYIALLGVALFGLIVGFSRLRSADGFSQPEQVSNAPVPKTPQRNQPIIVPSGPMTKEEINQFMSDQVSDPEFWRTMAKELKEQKEFERRMEKYQRDNAWRWRR